MGGNMSNEPFLHEDDFSICGNIVSPASLSSRYKKNTRNLILLSLFVTSTCSLNWSISLGKYLFNLNKKYDLDGDFKFNTARLINHSCNPNCEVAGTGLKVWVYAIRDIKKGEELTCDYGFGYDSDFKQFPCKCGSKNCCGFIVRAESRWRINRKFRMSVKNNNRVSK